MSRTPFHAYRVYVERDGKQIWSASGFSREEAVENYRLGVATKSIPEHGSFLVVKVKQRETA